MRHTIKIVAITALLALPSCLTSSKPDKALVRSSKLTHDFMSKILARETDDDETNDLDWKGLDGRTVTEVLKAWGLAIEKAEVLLK